MTSAEPASQSDFAEQILALEELRDLGMLDDDEFAALVTSPDGARPDSTASASITRSGEPAAGVIDRGRRSR